MGLALLLSTTTCSDFIEVVPKHSPVPTPTEVATEPEQIRAIFTSASVPARIVSESIYLDAPVIEMGWREVERWDQLVSEWEIPEQGAAWHRNSARPGDGSNVVISGHNGSTGGQVFANLEQLQVGDYITLWNDEGKLFAYRVGEKRVVRVFGASTENLEYLEKVMAPTAQEQLTLITCWPNWTNTHRLVVIAIPL